MSEVAQSVRVEVFHRILEGLQDVERHATGLAGDIVVGRDGGEGYVILEAPGPGRRYVRRVPDRAAVDALLALRMRQAERAWDG